MREVEGAVSVAEETCMLVRSRKLQFFFYNGREPAHGSPIIFNINIRRTTLAIKKEESQITRVVTLLFVVIQIKSHKMYQNGLACLELYTRIFHDHPSGKVRT